MPELQPNGNVIYPDFRRVEQNYGYSAVFKPGEFVAPRTYVPQTSRQYKCRKVDGDTDWHKFGFPEPERGLRIRRIYHDTFPELYNQMNQDDVLNVRGASKRYIGTTRRNILPDLDDTQATISWWSAKPEKEDIDDRKEINRSLCESSAFSNSSTVKNSQGSLASERITCNLWQLIKAYKESVGVDNVHLRTLGTFRYITEVMHAVLVCPADVPTDDFVSFPIIEQEEGESFEWKPYCTDSRRMWDHLSFAFYLKEGEHISIPAGMYSRELPNNGWMH